MKRGQHGKRNPRVLTGVTDFGNVSVDYLAIPLERVVTFYRDHVFKWSPKIQPGCYYIDPVKGMVLFERKTYHGTAIRA